MKVARLLPRCFACRVERVSIALEPIDRRYDVRSLECPSCKSIVRLVEHRMSNGAPCINMKRQVG
jgi:hypothetical protein